MIMCEQDFDSSDFELASDLAWHMMQHDHLTETDALYKAAREYNINPDSLIRYWNE